MAPLLALLLLSASASADPSLSTASVHASRAACLRQPRLVCELRPTTGNRVLGTLFFAPRYLSRRPAATRCTTHVRARLRNLRAGLHGLHIHAFGDARRSDASLLGGHFSSPRGRAGVPHRLPAEPGRRHWGDLGNVEAWKGGRATYDRLDDVLKTPAIVGRGVVLHADEDLGVAEQPTGAAGARQAYCVIGFANPTMRF